MKKLEIKPMQASHLPEILEIEKDVFPAPWTPGIFRQELSRGRVSRMYVALLENRVVGYELAWFLEDIVHLINIAVARSYQRGKIGTALLEFILREAVEEGKQYVTLEVRESNKDAQAFYNAFNFVNVGIQKDYYSDNRENAVVFMLDLRKYPLRGAAGPEDGGLCSSHPLGGARLAVMLGSGLGGVCGDFAVEDSMAFEDIPGLTSSVVLGHRGELRKCAVHKGCCLFILGRKHYYEGANSEIQALIRFIVSIGVKELIIISAAGGLDKSLLPGELVIIDRLMDLQNRRFVVRDERTALAERHDRTDRQSGRRSRILPGEKSLALLERGGGPGALHLDRFLSKRLQEAALTAGISLKRGTLACLPGPAYETAAEVRALRGMGADLATMSAAPELYFANLLGLNAAVLCLVTNRATGLSAGPLKHEDVLERSGRAAAAIGELIVQLVGKN